MSEAKNDGGPAFPVSTGDPHKEYQDGPYTAQFPGMTLRDYFAIRCLPISRSTFPEGLGGGWDELAAHAYLLADAMLRARGAA